MCRSVINRERRAKSMVPGLVALCLYCGMASASLSQENILSSANSLGRASILVSETRHDFGQVDEGAKVSHEFIVENKGKTDLTINKVSPDCGCTVAHFDRVIPPGGKGQIRLEVSLAGYKGSVKKTTTVKCNDPQTPQLQLVMQGNVRTLIDVLPGNTISFRGRAEGLDSRTIDLVGSAVPFHIRKIQSNLEGRVAHELETVEEGKRYRLKVSNLIQQGDYSGSLWLQTDLPQKPDVMIRITGAVEGEISVNPKTLFIGKMTAQQPVRSGSVLVIGNSGKPFKITNLNHDDKILAVTQHPLADKNGYRLEITPKLEDLSPGARQQSLLSIETDLAPGGKSEVLIQVINTQ